MVADVSRYQACLLGLACDDADTTAAICGLLAGAYYGMDAIPSGWLGKLAMRDEIKALAAQLHACATRRV